MSEHRDEFATERRETIIEALSWWEDEDGRWGHEKARDVLAAHEDEWCAVPPTQPPAAPETDVRLTQAEKDALWDATDRAYVDTTTWDHEVESEVERTVERIVAERVRVVEGERDAARREERMRAEDHANAWREVAIVTARAESAEAAHRALQAIAEDIAYQHAATIDGEYGCCHDEDALRAGGRVPELDGDEFDPIPDDCPGKQTLDRHLARIAREGR